jgi:hypothetical protein
MMIQRQSQRLVVEIPIALTTVLESLEGVIVDLSTHGAQIAGCAIPRGTRFQFEYMDQTVFAECMWSEIDRIGVKFAFPLTEGPLFDRLQIALATSPIQASFRASGLRPAEITPGRGFGRAPTGGQSRR